MTAGSSPRWSARAAAVLAALLGTAFLPSVTAPASGAAVTDPLFAPLRGFTAERTDDSRVVPRTAKAFRVDLSRVSASLSQAPTSRAVRDGARPMLFSLPDPSGAMVSFRVQETRTMQAGLAARHPEITTYAGRGVTDPGASIVLDVTPMGFHASVIADGGARSWYVDPAYNRRGTTTHLSYARSAVPAPDRAFVEPELDQATETQIADLAAKAGPLVKQRTFRLALVTDQSYASYFGTQNVTAEKVTLMNRVNQLYNDDLAVKMVLVDGTDLLNLDSDALAVEPDGPCGANACYDQADLDGGCTGTLLNRTEFVLGQIIGAENFDIGHIGLGINGGGIAGLGVVGEQYKADGCTGLPFPKGDFYAVDYVAHEMGHQFGGNHTFNGALVNCSLTNREGTASVEPGSGSSVMAYAGICGRDDLQPHSDPYFSQRSIDEITAHVTGSRQTYDEEQVVNLRNFDTTGESFQLTYPNRNPVTITRGLGGNYNALGIAQAVQTLTGETARVSGYDGATSPGTAGFTLDFDTISSGVDVKTLGVQGVGEVTGFVGTIYNGGLGTNQGTAVETSNHAPEVTAPADKTIPLRTPFTLTAEGSDADDDDLTYLWEQNDEGSASPTGGTELFDNTKTDGPLFRVFGVAAQVSTEDALTSPAPGQNNATSDASRTFPDMQQVLYGRTNAASGECPAAPPEPAEGEPDVDIPQPTIDCYSEFLPTADYGDAVAGRALNFRVTARDRYATGGGTAHDDVRLTLDPTAGPFLVTSRASTGQPAQGGSAETVTWDVNGTAKAALAPTVSISLSTDGGETFPYVLAESTPNDGSESITWPDVSTEDARVRVSAVGNYFFDVNNANFEITSPVSLTEVPDQSVQYSDPFDGTVTFTASAEEADGDQLEAVVDGVEGITVTRGTTSADGVRPGTAQFTLGGAVTEDVGSYTLGITVSEPSASAVQLVPVKVKPEDALVDYTGQTESTADHTGTATFELSATVTEADDGSPGDVSTALVTFVDRASGDSLCGAPVTGGPGTGTATCTGQLDSDGDQTQYTVGSVVGDNYLRNASSDDVVVVVDEGDPDTTPPNTEITRGPGEGSFFVGNTVTFRYLASNDAQSYACTLDGKGVLCGEGSKKLRKLPAGTHTFTVAAIDESGNVDPTPASRRFFRPYAVNQLDRSGTWSEHDARQAYRGRWLGSSDPGASVSRIGHHTRRIAVVVGTSPRAGKIAVFLGGDRIATLSLHSAQERVRVVIPVATFNRPRKGKVEVVVVGRKPVRIEGLGLG